MSQLQDILVNVLIGLRQGENPQNVVESLKEVETEDPVERSILVSVIKQLSGTIDDRSILGKLLKLDQEGLLMLKKSSKDFLSFDPIKDVERVKIFAFWSKVIEKLIERLGE